MSNDLAFNSEAEQPTPNAFVQWKGTDVCMDFWCDCGAQCHFDGYFAYVVKCPHCSALWQMPSHIYPRKVDEKTYLGHIEMAKEMEPDEDHCDAVVENGVTIFQPHPVR